MDQLGLLDFLDQRENMDHQESLDHQVKESLVFQAQWVHRGNRVLEDFLVNLEYLAFLVLLVHLGLRLAKVLFFLS